MTIQTAQQYMGEDFDGSTGFYVVGPNGVAVDYFDTEQEAQAYVEACQ